MKKTNVLGLLMLGLAALLIVICAMLSGVECWGQTTQPATQPGNYAQQFATVGQSIDLLLTAKNAQLSIAQSQLSQQQDQIAALQAVLDQVTVKPGADLGARLASAKTNELIILRPGASYPPITTVSVKSAGVKLIGYGNSLVVNAAAGASSGISVEAPYFEASGLSTSGNAVLFKIRGTASNFYIHNCVVGKAAIQQEFVNIDYGADNGRIENCTVGMTGGTNVFCSASNLTVNGLTSGGSQGEQDIRVDGNPRPHDILIANCNLKNHNTAGKEVITARECNRIEIDNTSIDGYCSFGQGGDDGINHCTGIKLGYDTFWSLRPGGALVQCQPGCDVFIDHPTLPGSATDAAFTIFQRGLLKFSTPRITGSPQLKPIAFANGGGTVQDLTGINTTQPAGSTSN